MAQKVLTVLTDDLDGKELKSGDGETVTFALDGISYEMDLSKKNADKFRGVFQDYIAAGRKVSTQRQIGGKTRTVNSVTRDYDPKAVRKWAESNKVDIPARGRIPADILERYKAEGN